MGEGDPNPNSKGNQGSGDDHETGVDAVLLERARVHAGQTAVQPVELPADLTCNYD